mgnify:FL=1
MQDGREKPLPSTQPRKIGEMREHRWFRTEEHQALFTKRRYLAPLQAHQAPWSVLVAAIGPYWKEGCEDAVWAMCKAHHEAGYEVAMVEIPDLCYRPYDALGTMRNAAYMQAMDEGWEWICYVDNDVRPPEDAVTKLIGHMLPIVAPRLKYLDGAPTGVSQATMEGGRGPAMVSSITLSMIVFQTAVFRPWWRGDFWADAIGAAEEHHFRRLAAIGHHPFVDTDVEVEVLGAPHYPLDNRPKKDGDALQR